MTNMPQLHFREAKAADLPAIVHMLANDPLGAKREHDSDPLAPSYINAFERIDNDVNAHLFVVEQDKKIIGVAQLNILHYLTYQGGSRALIEGVRIAESHRHQGIGQQLFEYLIQQARQHHCHVVQLTTDKARPEALHFYQKLGFVDSHIGLKLHLKPMQHQAS